MFITNGSGDLYFIAARTDPEAKGSRAITMFIVEKGARLQGRPRARQDRLALLRYRRARLRGLPRAGRERAGRAQSRLLFDHGQPPDRAAGDRGDGHGRAREALRLTFEHVNVRTAFGAPLWTNRRSVSVSRRLAEVEAARQLVHHTAGSMPRGPIAWPSLDGEGAGRRSGEPGSLRLCAVPRRHGLRARDGGRAHGRDARFSRSAAALRKSCWRKSPSASTASPTDAVYFGTTTNGPTASTAHSVPPARTHSPTASLAAALSLARPETMPRRPLRASAMARQSLATR